jgi:hypothetical protein
LIIITIITNKDNHENSNSSRFGYHKALILHLNVNTVIRKHKKVQSRHFTERSIEEFKCLLNKESWQEVFKALEVNAALQKFMDTFYYYFNIACPCKSVFVSKSYSSKWITQGIKISSERKHFLNIVKKENSLSREAPDYIKKTSTHIKKSTKGSQKNR